MSIPPLPWPPRDTSFDRSWLASATPDTLRNVVVQLLARVQTLEIENAALVYAAESFGALADRLNDALRGGRELH